MIGACKRCGEAFMPKRLAQVYCSRRCRVADAVARHRSDYMEANPSRIPEKRLQAVAPAPGPLSDGSTMVWPARDEHPRDEHPNGPTPGALQGDDYQLEYYADGYPKLPDCLRRSAF